MFRKKSNKRRLKVMLVCGSGIVSSTLVNPAVETILDELGYSYEIIKGGFNNISLHSGLDLILTTMTGMPEEIRNMGIPIVVVTDIFKGQNEKVKEKIAKALKED